MQRLFQVTKAYHSENLVYHLGRFAEKKVNFTLGLDASAFRRVKGACSVIMFKGTCALEFGAPVSGE